MPSGTTADGLELVSSLTNLQTLDVHGYKIETGYAPLRKLNNLKVLGLGTYRTSDAELAHLGCLNNLQALLIGNTGISNAGLEHLRALNNLQSLDICYTNVDLNGVKNLLLQHPNLRRLWVSPYDRDDNLLWLDRPGLTNYHAVQRSWLSQGGLIGNIYNRTILD